MTILRIQRCKKKYFPLHEKQLTEVGTIVGSIDFIAYKLSHRSTWYHEKNELCNLQHQLIAILEEAKSQKDGVIMDFAYMGIQIVDKLYDLYSYSQ